MMYDFYLMLWENVLHENMGEIYQPFNMVGAYAPVITKGTSGNYYKKYL